MMMGTYRRAARWPAIMLMAAMTLAGCSYSGPQDETNGETSSTATSSSEGSSSGNGSNGNGSSGNGSSTGSSSNGGGSSTGGNGSEEPAYAWGLPPSDTSVSGNDGPAYAALQRGCAEGQAFLDAVAPNGYGFRSPLNVVLFAAGIKLCNGDVDGAAELYAYGTQRYGLSGLPEGRPECELYKSVRSVLEQQPRTAFPCPGGLPPGDIVNEGLVDDPLTMDVDESQPTDSPTPTEDTTTPTEDTTAPTTATDTSTDETAATTTESQSPTETTESALPTP